MSKLSEDPNERATQLKWIGVALMASAGPIAFAQRDLSRRRKDEIRGPKLFWRLWALNGVGAVAYLRFGRKADG
jgi:hypothetical protein